MYKPLLALVLITFGCGGGDAPTRYLNGKFELFVGVDVDVEQCSGQRFNGTITLTASDLADEQPEHVHVFLWNANTDVWTELVKWPATVDAPQNIEQDLGVQGACEQSGLSLVFVPISKNYYGDPRFITLQSGAASGAMTRYVQETDNNEVTFFCPVEQVDEVAVSVYNFNYRRLETTSTLMPESDSGTEWVGAVPALKASEDVLILEGKKGSDLICSYFL